MSLVTVASSLALPIRRNLLPFALSVLLCPFLFQASVLRVAIFKPLSAPVSMPMASERFLQFHARSCMLAVAAILLAWPRLKQVHCATVSTRRHVFYSQTLLQDN